MTYFSDESPWNKKTIWGIDGFRNSIHYEDIDKKYNGRKICGNTTSSISLPSKAIEWIIFMLIDLGKINILRYKYISYLYKLQRYLQITDWLSFSICQQSSNNNISITYEAGEFVFCPGIVLLNRNIKRYCGISNLCWLCRYLKNIY